MLTKAHKFIPEMIGKIVEVYLPNSNHGVQAYGMGRLASVVADNEFTYVRFENETLGFIIRYPNEVTVTIDAYDF